MIYQKGRFLTTNIITYDAEDCHRSFSVQTHLPTMQFVIEWARGSVPVELFDTNVFDNKGPHSTNLPTETIRFQKLFDELQLINEDVENPNYMAFDERLKEDRHLLRHTHRDDVQSLIDEGSPPLTKEGRVNTLTQTKARASSPLETVGI